MKLFDLGDRLTGIKDVLCRVAIMLDSNLDDNVEWNGNFSREAFSLGFPKIRAAWTWKNAHKRSWISTSADNCANLFSHCKF